MFVLLYKRADDAVFDDFPKISEDFQKLFRRPARIPTYSEHFPDISEDFPKITEDCRRRPKKIRRCFDHTPTNFSVVEGAKEKCYQI